MTKPKKPATGKPKPVKKPATASQTVTITNTLAHESTLVEGPDPVQAWQRGESIALSK